MASENFYQRLDMCNKLREGCELEDAIKAITSAASTLQGIYGGFDSELLLLLAEKLCREYIHDYLWKRECDWDEYNECPDDVFTHFTGGATKLSEKEFNDCR